VFKPSPIDAVQLCEYQDVRSALLEKREIAFLDVREEDPHAQAHPLFAANFPLSRVELDAYSKLPRRDVQIVTLDEGDDDVLESDAMLAARRLVALGFSRVAVFAGGVRAWQAAGGELFRDVNVPSKSFGELVEAKRHTPSLSAPEVKALIEQHADVVIVDARRYDEYNTMSIPTATSCPGAELVLRIAELAPRPETQVIVNCAGRTRSIIGTQSLINAGIPNKVSALRNGTIGWTLAGQALDKGETRKCKDVSEHTRLTAAARARSVAERAGVKPVTWSEAQTWQAQAERTTYFFDTRTPEEYAAGHIAGFRSTPGGQLVQETEMVAPVRGARIVLVDTDGVRANMTASWLAQMAWDVYVLTDLPAQIFAETGPWVAEWAKPPVVATIAVAELAAALVNDLAAKKIVVVDLSRHAQYVQAHIPGAQYVLRSQFKQALSRLPKASAYVLVCPDGLLSTHAHAEIAALLKVPVSVLIGGTQAWKAAGQSVEKGATALMSDPIDRYKRPYEGTDAPHEAMQAYLDWEFGLVAQLGIDGTHHFAVL
jgi:rhodanese-related sulfurtransferase